MTVNVLLFASYAEAFGTPRFALELRPGARAADVLGHLRALPGADRLPPTPITAVNEEYSTPDHPLEPGDEIAIIPPVAGG